MPAELSSKTPSPKINVDSHQTKKKPTGDACDDMELSVIKKNEYSEYEAVHPYTLERSVQYRS